MTSKSIQSVCLSCVEVYGWAERLAKNPELEFLAQSLSSFEAQAEIILRTCAREAPATKWALDEAAVPCWAAAALGAGLYADFKVESGTHLAVICGVEPKVYLSADEAKVVMLRIVGSRAEKVKAAQVRAICKEVDVHPAIFGQCDRSWDEVLYFLTKRRHSDFLRTISLALGEWFADHPESPYRRMYIEALQVQAQKNLAIGRIEARAKAAAVRAFLNDFYRFLQASIVKGKVEAPERI